jgi:shikimate dehydrogenase
MSAPPPIDGHTRLMGIIGDPITQVRTPQAINPIFAAMGAPILCVPFHIGAGGLADAVAGLRTMRNVVGFGVTLPHKQAICALLDSLDPAARRVGAANVVRREADGSLRGYQFDGAGFVRGLRARGHDPAGRPVLLLGAGGAAAAVALALAEAGVTRMTVANRTQAKAAALAALVNDACGRALAQPGPARPAARALIVNATALGMAPDDPLPMDAGRIARDMLVAEVVASPETTAFLHAAQARGADTHSGIWMIRNQVDLIARHLAETGAP